MGMGVAIFIILILAGGYYAYSNDLFTKNTITNPLDNLINAKNNTPSSTITEIDDKTFFGKPFSYYNCQNHEDCKNVFGAGTICELNQTSNYYGQCYTN